MYHYLKLILFYTFFAFWFIGCGGGGSSGNDTSDQTSTPNITLDISVESKEEAANFLEYATFGPRIEDIDVLVNAGRYDTWFNEQFKKTPSNYINWINKHQGINLKDEAIRKAFYNAWYSIVVNSEDQLRQRVALALSEIIVVSAIGVESSYSVADYFDLLVEHAFGNYRDILYQTALHPAMGIYLSTLGNMKEHTTPEGTLVHADENFAREILQLFSIGLVQLELNGEQKLENGKSIPTYTQKDIEEFAKVYTGWSSDNGGFFYLDGTTTLTSLTQPMIAYEEYHDTREKIFSNTFNYAYNEPQSIPSGLSANDDLNHAIDIIFNHPNVGPFIGKKLIQRLVTSNPTPEYIARVTAVFNDNGSGVRGDMSAVVAAILTDEEALLQYKAQKTDLHVQGKLREQLIRVASVMRIFHAKGDPAISTYQFYDFTAAGFPGLHLRPMFAPSVFNYFLPTFQPSGILQDNGLVAPEFQVLPPLKINDFGEVMLSVIGLTNMFDDKITLDLTYEKNLLATQGETALLDHLNLVLLSGHMSDALKNDLIIYTENKKTVPDIIEQLIALIVLSAEYAIER